MASTMNLQQTLMWAMAFLNYQPLTIGGLEPALSTGNMVMQVILGPPFAWRWNRATATFVVDNTHYDFTKALPNLGFIEKATATDPDTNDIKELTVRNVLSATSETSRPEFIATQGDDGGGTITFRLQPMPNKAYTITVVYQNKAPLMSSLASIWQPIPDEFAYIFNWGFLSIASILVDDPRFPIFSQKFTSHLLGAQQGLDEMQKALFLGNWETITKQMQANAMKVQQGNAARQIG